MFSKLGKTLFVVASLLGVVSPSLAQTPSKLVLQIHRVDCVDETNSGVFIGEQGDDHMIMGAVAIAPNGRKTQVKAIKVGTFERDGTHETFSTPRAFVSMPIAAGVLRQYSVLLVLAEQDISGGTDEFVKKLIEESDASGAGGEKSDGGATALAAAAAKEIADKLIDLAKERLKENAKDDIFVPLEATVALRESDLRFPNGKTTTIPKIVTFSGHGGKYKVTYSWMLVS
jgi:hypothetical protein